MWDLLRLGMFYALWEESQSYDYICSQGLDNLLEVENVV